METKYGKLVVLELSHVDYKSRNFYLCQCSCGKKKIVQEGLLKSGNTKSCGCLLKEAAQQKRLPNKGSQITAVLLGYKRHAKDRGYCWELARAEFEALILANCHYCKAKPANKKTTKNSLEPLYYNGIDRRNNLEGYHANNVLTCCAICNRAKGNMSYEDFIQWIKAMADQWS